MIERMRENTTAIKTEELNIITREEAILQVSLLRQDMYVMGNNDSEILALERLLKSLREDGDKLTQEDFQEAVTEAHKIMDRKMHNH